MAAGKDFGTANYPAYATKQALMEDIEAELQKAAPNRDILFQIQQRLNNTTTSGWGDPAYTRT